MEIGEELTEAEFDNIMEYCYYNDLKIHYSYNQLTNKYVVINLSKDLKKEIVNTILLKIHPIHRSYFTLIDYYGIVDLLKKIDNYNELDNVIDLIKENKVNQLVVNKIIRIHKNFQQRIVFNNKMLYKIERCLRYLNMKNRLDEIIKMIKNLI